MDKDIKFDWLKILGLMLLLVALIIGVKLLSNFEPVDSENNVIENIVSVDETDIQESDADQIIENTTEEIVVE